MCESDSGSPEKKWNGSSQKKFYVKCDLRLERQTHNIILYFYKGDRIHIESKSQSGSQADSGGTCHSFASGDHLAESGRGVG